ncbi:hypothetical protein [Natronobacterium gregoryi]|uniref:Uncharacterized protein n=2 Tax=Natronobacterium gregoryi TaxID=44930 RepID=L0AK01_NATGS|nr:hypothetical protein [Natronobacterium gregoryi]AFZ73779.1 hypothetical protein Natgr_2630 [Natronobacterium gregoryi SP2]ELY65673.1 hypothetical protein C490_13700 [Natronobacterium gregoryi SP2]PLK18726.1 hypothetical protein CYV19_17245 [Natronobacterium gregoryi SP2]SFJ65909.1 hypothetical protein SAMN05443661_15316 [Natronobacterium gregoryi]
MQRVIDRKLYDTDQAEQIARYAPLTDKGDFNYLIETLYKTSDGEYFLHGDGGAATKWAEKISNKRMSSEEIQLLTDEEALNWCEERAVDGEIVVEEFSHLVET